MNLLFIEDEYPAAERLQKLVQRVEPGAHILAVIESVAQGVEWLTNHEAPDLILSDIQLADGLSFEIFERVVLRCPVIFTTSYDAYALRAFKVHSLDYLLKPIKEAELQAALRRFREVRASVGPETHFSKIEQLLDSLDRTPRAYKARFLVRHREQLIPVPTTDIAFLHSQHEQVCLVTADNKRYIVDYTLEQLEKLLDPARFFRVNRRVLATPDAIQRIDLHFNGKLKLTLRPELPDEVLVSREKAPAFRGWLEGA